MKKYYIGLNQFNNDIKDKKKHSFWIWLYHIEIPIIIYITADFTVSLNNEIYEKVVTGKDYRKTDKGKCEKSQKICLTRLSFCSITQTIYDPCENSSYGESPFI